MRSNQRIRLHIPGAIAAGLLAACSNTVGGSDPMPEPSALTIEHIEDPFPSLAAVDGKGRVYSTYWNGSDDIGHRMVVTVENPATSERGQLRIAAIEETGVTEISVTGDFGEGTWSDEGKAEGAEPPEDLLAPYQAWLDHWTAAARDPAHAEYLHPPDQGDAQLQNAICVGVCGTIKSASCNFKNVYGRLLCELAGVFVCAEFCSHTDGELSCFVTDDGGCVRETCCQPFYGCYTYDISGCPY